MAKSATMNAPANRVQNQAPETQASVEKNGEAPAKRGRKGRQLPDGKLDSKQRAKLALYPNSDLTSIPDDWNYTVHKPLSSRMFAGDDKDEKAALVAAFYNKYRNDVLKQGNKIPYMQPGMELLESLPADFDSKVHKIDERDFKSSVHYLKAMREIAVKELAALDVQIQIAEEFSSKPNLAKAAKFLGKGDLTLEEMESLSRLLEKQKERFATKAAE